MKKFLKRLSMFAIALFVVPVAFFFAACGKNDDCKCQDGDQCICGDDCDCDCDLCS